MKFCSFDLETAKIVPHIYTIILSDGNEIGPLDHQAFLQELSSREDWELKKLDVRPDDFDNHRPLGISCAATLCTGDNHAMEWFDGKQVAYESEEPCYGPQMTQQQSQNLVKYLIDMKQAGFIPLTFHGLQFDFHVLAEESGMWEECIDLALNHVDILFQFFCVKGFSISLNQALAGMGLEGKTEGMSGGLAPVLWKTGKHREVLDYVAQDVSQPLKLAHKVQTFRGLTWITNKGNPSKRPAPISRWLTVEECLNLPLPDTSWMDASQVRSRDDFFIWIKEYESKKKGSGRVANRELVNNQLSFL